MEQNPGFFQLIGNAWRDGWRALCRMPLVFLSLGILFVVCEAILFFLDSGSSNFSETNISLSFHASVLFYVINMLIIAALLSPLMITVHRFVLLGEVSHWGALRWNSRLRRFYMWFLVIYAVFLVPKIIQALGSSPVWSLLSFLCQLALIYWVTRLCLILPAIASDSPSANYHDAMQSTRGHFWFILGVKAVNSLVMFVPIWVLIAIGIALGYFPRSDALFTQHLGPLLILGSVILLVALIVYVAFMLSATAALDAGLFKRYGNRLATEPQLA